MAKWLRHMLKSHGLLVKFDYRLGGWGPERLKYWLCNRAGWRYKFLEGPSLMDLENFGGARGGQYWFLETLGGATAPLAPRKTGPELGPLWKRLEFLKNEVHLCILKASKLQLIKVGTYFTSSGNWTRADEIDKSKSVRIGFPDDAKYVPTLMSCSSDAL